MRAAARLILDLPRKSHVSDAIRRQLHWLDISEPVRCKLCVLAARCIHGLAPSYLSKFCIPVQFDRRPITSPFCRIWSSVHSIDEHCNYWPSGIIVVACPAAWNSLSPEFHNKSLSLMTFRKKLKTYLFKTN